MASQPFKSLFWAGVFAGASSFGWWLASAAAAADAAACGSSRLALFAGLDGSSGAFGLGRARVKAQVGQKLLPKDCLAAAPGPSEGPGGPKTAP